MIFLGFMGLVVFYILFNIFMDGLSDTLEKSDAFAKPDTLEKSEGSQNDSSSSEGGSWGFLGYVLFGSEHDWYDD